MVAPQKRSAESSNDTGAKKGKFDKSSQFKKSGGSKFEAKKSFGKPGIKYYYYQTVFDIANHCPFLRFELFVFISVNKVFPVFLSEQPDPSTIRNKSVDRGSVRYHMYPKPKVPPVSSFKNSQTTSAQEEEKTKMAIYYSLLI